MGQRSAHEGAARPGRLYDAATTELLGSFAHRGETHAPAAFRRETASIVGDFQEKSFRSLVDGETDVTMFRPRVARDVRQRFLSDAVGGHLCGGGQRRQAIGLRRIDRDAQAVRAILRGCLAYGADEAEVVERGRA